MENANEVVRTRPGKQPVLKRIDLAWARALMRAKTGSDRLQPPPSKLELSEIECWFLDLCKI